MQWSWLSCLHSCKSCDEDHSPVMFAIKEEGVFDSALCYKIQVKVKPYKAIVKFSKNQTI